ncbi:MAG: hypothetical protein KAR20_20455, partial [Candidatus Heimdallarchaeota archaeon]|nr:hypothetical protein [Candidatus Heimdallarchaeota archaeon]
MEGLINYRLEKRKENIMENNTKCGENVMKDKIICFLVFLAFLAVFGCTSKKDAARDDEYSVALTEWSEKLEVFMEYQMPTPGEEISFGVHLTDLSD